MKAISKQIVCNDPSLNKFVIFEHNILERVEKKTRFTRKYDRKSQDIYYIGEIGEECIYELLHNLRMNYGRYNNPYISQYSIYRNQLYFDEYQKEGMFSISDLTAHPYLIQIKTTCFPIEHLRYLPIERDLNSDIYALVFHDKINKKCYAKGWISRHEIIEKLEGFQINEYNKISIPESYLHKDFSEIIRRENSIPKWQCKRSKAHYLLGCLVHDTEHQYYSNGGYKRIFRVMRSYGDIYDYIIYNMEDFFKLVNLIHYNLFKKNIKDNKIINLEFSPSLFLKLVKEYCLKNHNNIYEGGDLRIVSYTKKLKEWYLKERLK